MNELKTEKLNNILEHLVSENGVTGYGLETIEPIFKSKGEARRLIKQGGVYYTNKIDNPNFWRKWKVLDNDIDDNFFLIRVGSSPGKLKFYTSFREFKGKKEIRDLSKAIRDL